jgi:hypothetical protein
VEIEMTRVRLVRLVAAVGLSAAAVVALADPLAGQDRKADPVTVKTILKVEFAIQEIDPPNLVVYATGEVPTGGWSGAKLTRKKYDTPPADGIQDYTLTAVAPTGIVTQALSKVEARDTWSRYTVEAPWLKGVRVHGAGKGVVVKMLTERPKQ